MKKEDFIKQLKKQYGLNRSDCKLIIMIALAEPELSGQFKPQKSDNKVDIRHITLTLHWSKLKPAKKLADAALKLEAWQASTYCPPPWSTGIPTVVTYQGLMDDLKTALDAVGKKRATSDQKKAIEKAAGKLQTATKQIMTVWQNKADSDITNAVAIAIDGDFDYTSHGTRGPRENGLFQTTETGVLLGQLSGPGRRDWQSTPDNGKTIVKEDGTSGGVKVLRGLTSGQKYGLRGRVVLTKGRYGDWSNWMYEEAP